MGRVYTAAFSEVAAGTAIKDLIEIIAATNVSVIVHELNISAKSISDEKFLLEVFRISASGSVGSAGDERPIDPGGVAADSAVEFNNTTQATKSGGILRAQEWSNLIPFEYYPFIEDRITIEGAAGLVLRSKAYWPSRSVAPSETIRFTSKSTLPQGRW